MRQAHTLFDLTLGLVESQKPKCLLIASKHFGNALQDAKPDCELIDLDINLENLEDLISNYVESADMVLLAEDLDQLEKPKAVALIGQLRNHLNARIAVLTSKNSALSFNDMIGLGFKREDSDEEGRNLYSYDIANYNKKRAWNNARFWANPENFDKYRW